MDCFDKDGNGMLDLEELKQELRGLACTRDCPLRPVPPSPAGGQGTLLDANYRSMIKGFFNGANVNLTLLFESNGSLCNQTLFHQQVDPQQNILIVANTSEGKVVGSYYSLKLQGLPT